MKDSLGDRMKTFEDVFRFKLPIRMPVILRLDGKSFHSLCRGLNKPFDDRLITCMNETALYLCKNIQGATLAYIQSDEISILINNYKKLETKSWFDNNIQKMCSIAAGMASVRFSSVFNNIIDPNKIAVFDCRAFVLPKEEVNNMFVWRQLDATRNSIQMLARSLYSHSQCNNKNCNELQEMCFQAGKNWNDLPTTFKRGRCAVYNLIEKTSTNKATGQECVVLRGDWKIDNEIPILSKEKSYVEKLL